MSPGRTETPLEIPINLHVALGEVGHIGLNGIGVLVRHAIHTALDVESHRLLRLDESERQLRVLLVALHDG